MVEVRPFDPETAHPDAWAAFHAYRRIRNEEDDPGEPLLSDAECEHVMRRRWPLNESRRMVAIHAGAIIGSVGLTFRRPEAADCGAHAPFLWMWGGVVQPWRRQGVAAALLRPALALMQADGRTTASLSAEVPDGHAFLHAIGAVQKHRDVQNRLDLAGLDWAELAQWEAAVPPGLRWEMHAGRVPMPRLAAVLPEATALLQDVPQGELERPPARLHLQGYAAWYEEMDRSGGKHLSIMLMDRDTLVSLCEAEWDARFPTRVHQALTGVARPWRGRGLAKALKARMLRLVQEHLPGATLMTTSNAPVNAPILAINARLGFMRHKEYGTYQIGRDALAAWLATRTPRHGA